MRIETKYVCEICGLKYISRNDARDCEERGSAPAYPIVTIFGNNKRGAFYREMCFAVAKKNSTQGHSNRGACWATRDNGAGDSLGNEYCEMQDLGESDAHLNLDAPCTVRMIKWLRDQGHKIHIWTGGEAVELKL